ncbi:hypothetical protein HDU96_006938 [Phlyctochytrium bullatum]|nr:hypothetical protein HDU96_006938 [Phlyctochytrium bullatum]
MSGGGGITAAAGKDTVGGGQTAGGIAGSGTTGPGTAKQRQPSNKPGNSAAASSRQNPTAASRQAASATTSKRPPRPVPPSYLHYNDFVIWFDKGGQNQGALDASNQSTATRLGFAAPTVGKKPDLPPPPKPAEQSAPTDPTPPKPLSQAASLKNLEAQSQRAPSVIQEPRREPSITAAAASGRAPSVIAPPVERQQSIIAAASKERNASIIDPGPKERTQSILNPPAPPPSKPPAPIEVITPTAREQQRKPDQPSPAIPSVVADPHKTSSAKPSQRPAPPPARPPSPVKKPDPVPVSNSKTQPAGPPSKPKTPTAQVEKPAPAPPKKEPPPPPPVIAPKPTPSPAKPPPAEPPAPRPRPPPSPIPKPAPEQARPQPPPSPMPKREEKLYIPPPPPMPWKKKKSKSRTSSVPPPKREEIEAAKEKAAIEVAKEIHEGHTWVDRVAKELKSQREWSDRWSNLNDPKLYLGESGPDHFESKVMPTRWNAFAVADTGSGAAKSNVGNSYGVDLSSGDPGYEPPTFKITGPRDKFRENRVSLGSFNSLNGGANGGAQPNSVVQRDGMPKGGTGAISLVVTGGGLRRDAASNADAQSSTGPRSRKPSATKPGSRPQTPQASNRPGSAASSFGSGGAGSRPASAGSSTGSGPRNAWGAPPPSVHGRPGSAASSRPPSSAGYASAPGPGRYGDGRSGTSYENKVGAWVNSLGTADHAAGYNRLFAGTNVAWSHHPGSSKGPPSTKSAASTRPATPSAPASYQKPLVDPPYFTSGNSMFPSSADDFFSLVTPRDLAKAIHHPSATSYAFPPTTNREYGWQWAKTAASASVSATEAPAKVSEGRSERPKFMAYEMAFGGTSANHGREAWKRSLAATQG